MNPMYQTDFYKTGHAEQYPENTTLVYSNLTARGSRLQEIDRVVFFGLQAYIKEVLIKQWDTNFFNKDFDDLETDYLQSMAKYLGPDSVKTDKWRSLHELGYLPLKIKALPEGVACDLRVPMLTVVNTHPEFFWLTNFIETDLSAYIWGPITSATMAKHYKGVFDRWSEKTSDTEGFTSFQGHDFSYRGMWGAEAASRSGGGHLLSFVGTDTIPAIKWLENNYKGGDDGELVGCSVFASEHSVMCVSTGLNLAKSKTDWDNYEEGEFELFKRLITETYPSGIVSIVSDTWDLWKVLTEYLPKLKDTIVNRDGKVVIRPDSGDPVKIICGDSEADENLPEHKGVVELLWDTFGGTVNSKGYKELNPCIGAIYGDSITPMRAEAICSLLEHKGFASTNWVAGIGSYTYTYSTRDTFGMAVKSTYAEADGYKIEIFKDPITDNGLKKSARGLLRVDKSDGGYTLKDRVSWSEESGGELQTVFLDGNLTKEYTLSEIRKNTNDSTVDKQ